MGDIHFKMDEDMVCSIWKHMAGVKTHRLGLTPQVDKKKIVLVHQLKSIVGKVIKEPMKAQDGTKVLGRFSFTSIARRIVNSPDIVGTTVAVLMKGAELAVAAYDS